MKLKDRVVVITGASSGIGMELARRFSSMGNSVVLAARRGAILTALAQELEAAGGRAIAVPTDVTVRADVENLMRAAVDKYGRIDIVINNAGASPAVGTLMENREVDVRYTMDLNFMGGVYGVWAAAPFMEKNGGGLIVFVTSIVGKRGVPKSAAYCASKFAMQGMAESIRPELAVKNIRVLTVCPPGVDTAFFKVNRRENRRRFRLHPVEKIGRMIVRACERETRESLLTIDAKLLYWANVIFPSLLDWAVAKNKGVYK